MNAITAVYETPRGLCVEGELFRTGRLLFRFITWAVTDDERRLVAQILEATRPHGRPPPGRQPGNSHGGV
ncbi:MAG: hypothetical protein QM811_16670 [Pirellulales bacterium]